jgi:hypothetical protein
MSFKSQKFIEYGRKGAIVEIKIRGADGDSTDKFKATNQRDYSRVLNTIDRKYGYKPIIDVKDSINFDEDTNWLKKEMEW